MMNFTNFFTNFKVPVKSKTLHVPKQQRIRLDHKGNILDFDAMTSEEIDEYSRDPVEQERQKSPGRRHRNKSTIRCRYSYINSKSKIAESQERIRNSSEPKPMVLNYHTVRRSPEKDSNSTTNSTNTAEKANPLNPENKLILFCHGGAFFTQGSQSYELFLRKIVNELGGVPILAIDYSLTVPYPIALEEVLNVYLWAMSGADEVKQKLGFHPQKIILSGDSCGGTLCLALTIVLNELNKIVGKSAEVNGGCNRNHPNSQPIRLPIAIISEYLAFTLTKFSPSLALSIFDSLVEAHLLMLMVSVHGANLSTIGDFKKIEKSK